jgi:hypothetical protein
MIPVMITVMSGRIDEFILIKYIMTHEFILIKYIMTHEFILIKYIMTYEFITINLQINKNHNNFHSEKIYSNACI